MKKGFTMIELLVVIVILAVVGTGISVGVISVMQKGTEQVDALAEKSLADAALTYAIQNLYIENCKTGYLITEDNLDEPTDPDGTVCKVEISVKTLIDEGYLEDDIQACNKEAKVTIYNYKKQENANPQYKPVVISGTCKSN